MPKRAAEAYPFPREKSSKLVGVMGQKMEPFVFISAAKSSIGCH